MVQLNTEYPASTSRPRATKSGMIVHSLYDVSMYAGTKAQERYIAAGDDKTALNAALSEMPNATVTFYEVPVGEPFFDL